MKLRESLFAKLSAVALVLVLSVLVGCGAYFSANLFTRREVYKDSYVETGACERQMEDSAYDVSEYFSLTLLSQKQELTYEQQTELDTLRESIGPETKGNFVWQIMDGSGTVLLSNIEDDGAALSQLTNGDYRHQSFGLKDTVLGTDGSTTTTTTRYRIQYGLRDKLPYKDAYSKASSEFQYSKRWLTPVIILSGAGLIAVLLLYGFLAAAAGQKAGEDRIALNPFDKIWTEIPAALFFVLAFMAVFFAAEGSGWLLFVIALLGIWAVTFGLSLIRRAKAGMLYKTSFIHLIVRGFQAFSRHTTIFFRTVCLVGVFTIVQMLLFLSSNAVAILFLLMMNISIGVAGVWTAVQYEKIRKATDRMAAGELDQTIDVQTVPIFSKMARNLNSTQAAIQIAVQNATRSERMKTELITNVSHDIKTPLTSIVSYVGLLKSTAIDDPTALEYIDVLEKKSKRLAQLMADLVEASKVTSGNITVNLEPLNISELIKQAGGEFESRLEERHIQLLCRLPELPVFVVADGRHMWRVLDNLFGNAVKYALDNTRVYVDLLDTEQEALISIKNISREALGIQPDELMERFVRGDSSRYTEGSGLGLSIAKSLMELQQGSMNIQIDGDLFKVVLCLRKAPPSPPPSEPPVVMSPA